MKLTVRTASLLGFIGIVLLGLYVESVTGHSYITSPTSRSNQKQTTTGCRGPNCLGPCDRKSSSARSPITVARGADLNIQWPRNNHAGGFIRFAWAPTSQSDSHSQFDNNVQVIYCHEVGGCKPDDPRSPNGGDSAPKDGSRQPCQVTFKVPPHLTDGLWTLQWAWYGGAYSLGDYYSCVDYKISGGSSGSKPAAVFRGGDYSYPGQQKCKFFNTDRLHQCVNEPCNKPLFPSSREQSGPAYLPSSGSPPSNPTTTTGSRPSPPSNPTTTTGSRPSPPPSNPTTTTGSSSNPSGNCASARTLSKSTAVITKVETWGSTLHAYIQLRVVENSLPSWNIQILWPSALGSTKVSAVYNAGALQCEGSSPAHSIIKPVSSWARNLRAGRTLNIEVFARNNGMSSSAIQRGTTLKVYSV